MNLVFIIISIIVLIGVIAILYFVYIKISKKKKEDVVIKKDKLLNKIENKINSNIKTGKIILKDIKENNKNLIEEKNIYNAQENIDINELLQEANKEYKVKNFKKALELYKKIIDLDKNNYEVLKKIADIYIQQKEYEKALEILLKLHTLEPDINICKQIANIYNKQGSFDKAIIFYKKILSIDENNVFSYIKIGNIYEKLNQYANASEFYKSAYKIAPENIDVLYFLSKSYIKLNKLKEALELLNLLEKKFKKSKVLRKNQKNIYINTLNYKAFVYLKENDKKNAIKFYKEVLKIDPKNKLALKGLNKIK